MTLDQASQLARRIDISCVRAHHGRGDVEELAKQAREWGCINAHVLPHWLATLKELLDGSQTLPAGPIGFPSGGSTTASKCRETESVLEAGAREVDIVLNIARLIDGELDYVRGELRQIMAIIPPDLVVKAIIETSLLTVEQVKNATRIVADEGCAFVKTGTGWAGPVTTEVVREIARELEQIGASGVEIKAAGGIRTLSDTHALASAGATRFGIGLTSAVNILQEAKGA